MRLIPVFIAVAAFVLAQPVLAKGGPPNGAGPIGRLQAAVDALTSQVGALEAKDFQTGSDVNALTMRVSDLEKNTLGLDERLADLEKNTLGLDERVAALEDNAHLPPNLDVAGRTYCRTSSTTFLIGIPNFSAEILVKTVARQLATFDPAEVPGSVNFEPVSIVTATQGDNGVITLEENPLGDTVPATYTQTGTQLDVTFPSGNTLTHHVSSDGSSMHGWRIAPAIRNPANAMLIESTLVEIDSMTGAQCGADVAPGP